MGNEATRPCPTEEQVEHYLAGTCSRQEQADIESHAAGCARCRRWLEDAQANEALLDGLRRVMDEDAQMPAGPGDQTAETTNGPEAGRVTDLPGVQPQAEGYEIIEEIGRGGMGVVYKARQVGTRRMVALKVLLEPLLSSESARRRFEREIELAASLNHPNIVTIHDSGLSQGRYYFAMDLIAGQRLDRYIKDHPPGIRGRLKLMHKICLAVSYAHQRGVIHRDLKPSNILIDEAGEPHILDFGLAKTLRGEPGQPLLISVTGEVVGTLPYMAPEQASGSYGELDSRTDIYALGVILYEIVTGRYPYPVVGPMAEVLHHIAQTEPTRPRTIVPAIDDDVETMMLKALAKDKDRRYESAGALAADLGHYLAGEAIEAKRDSGWYVLRKSLRRHKLAVGLAGSLATAAVIVAVTMSSLYSRARQTTRQLTDQLHVSNIEHGRALALAQDMEQAEHLLWREFLQDPHDRLSLWTLREFYQQHPSLMQIATHGSSASCLAISPDGRTLATGDSTGQVQLWEIQSARLLSTLAVSEQALTSLTFGPGGRTLVCSSRDRVGQVWDVESGRCLITFREECHPLKGEGRGAASEPADPKHILPGSQESRFRISCSPDGKLLICYGLDSMLRVREAASGRLLASLKGHRQLVDCAVFSPDGRKIVSGGHDGAVRLWDAGTGQPERLMKGHMKPVTAVAFSPDGKAVASGSADALVMIWDPVSGKCLASLGEQDLQQATSVDCLQFHPTGRSLAAGYSPGQIRIWNLTTGYCRRTIAAHTGHQQYQRDAQMDLSFSPNGQSLASCCGSEAVRLWDVSETGSMGWLCGHWSHVVSVAFSPDGRTLASRGIDGIVLLRDIQSARCIGQPIGQSRWPTSIFTTNETWDNPEMVRLQHSLAYHPDGKMIATTGVDDTGVTLHEVPSCQPIAALPGHHDTVLSLAFSRDGRLLASGSRSGEIKLWETQRRTCVRTLADPDANAQVACLSFSPDGGRLASVSGKFVRLWDVATGQCVSSLAGGDSEVFAVAFSPDGQLLASSSQDGICLWEPAGERCLKKLDAHAGSVYDLAFRPDGQVLAGASHNRAVVMWEVPSGRYLASLQDDKRFLCCLAFAPGGSILAAGGSGQMVRFWDLTYYDQHIAGNYPSAYRSFVATNELAGLIDPAEISRCIQQLRHYAPKPRAEGTAGLKELTIQDRANLVYWGTLSNRGRIPGVRYMPGADGTAAQADGPAAGPPVDSRTRVELQAWLSYADFGAMSELQPWLTGPRIWKPAADEPRKPIGTPPALTELAVAGNIVQGQDNSITVSCVADDADRAVRSVTADLSQLGGSAAQALTKAGDGRWTWSGSLAPASNGFRTVTFTATDDRPATGTGRTTVTVRATDGKSLGVPRWTYLANAALYTCPTISPDGTIYVGSADGSLHAVNTDGSPKWRFATGRYIESSPAIGADGTIYFGSADGRLYALNPNGTKRWEYRAGGITSSPAIGRDGTIYVGSFDREVHAINPDGTRKWAYTTQSIFHRSSPAIGKDGTIYATSFDGILHALRPDGTQAWEVRVGDYVIASPAIGSDGTIYIGSMDNAYGPDFTIYDGTGDRRLCAVRPDGTIRWEYVPAYDIDSSPAVGTDGTIYAHDGYDLLALNPDGTRAWSFYTGQPVWGGPAIGSDGTIYLGCDAGRILAISSSGTTCWEFQARGKILGAPAIGPDGTVYIASKDRILYALRGSGRLADAPWPMFGRDVAHSGRVADR